MISRKTFFIHLTIIIFAGAIFNIAEVSAFTYKATEPLPGAAAGVTDIGSYMNNLFNFLLGVAAILAVVKIVLAGLKYIYAAGNPSTISDAKDSIYWAIFGLILALSSVLILTTINPNLTGSTLNISGGPTGGGTGAGGGTGSGTGTGGGTPGGGITTPPGGAVGTGNENHNDEGPSGAISMGAVSASLKPLEQLGPSLTKDNTFLLIDKSAKTLSVYKDNQLIASTNINVGLADQAGTQTGGRQGDNITPVGTFTITNDIRRNSVDGVYTNDGRSSLGAAFMGISATDQNGNYRGIGIHSRADDKLNPTNGCVRTSNADVNLLSQYIKPGTTIKIQN